MKARRILNADLEMNLRSLFVDEQENIITIAEDKQT